MFKGVIVGDYIADILVDDKIIIELKACEKMDNIHKAQVINYLKVTNKKLGPFDKFW
jgi:GxxExxY protein